jgi:hypothetical protein
MVIPFNKRITGERINLPGTKDSLVSHTSSSVGFDTIPSSDYNATIIPSPVTVVSNIKAVAIVGVADTAKAELEMSVGGIIIEVKEEDLLAPSLFLQAKTALGTAGTGIHVHRGYIEARTGLGNDVELGVVVVVDPADIELLRDIFVIACVKLDSGVNFERIVVDVHTQIYLTLGHGFDLNNIIMARDVVRTIGTGFKITIMGIAPDDGSVPALHRVIRTDDGGRRTLSDPLTWRKSTSKVKYGQNYGPCIVSLGSTMG